MSNLNLKIGRQTAEQERVAQNWRTRALVLTRGNRTALGTVLIAVLGRAASNPPRVAGGAVIDEHGWVLAPFQDRGMFRAEIMKLCTVEQLTAGFRRVADELKLSDPERVELFEEIQKWINEDRRPQTDTDRATFEGLSQRDREAGIQMGLDSFNRPPE